MTAAKPAEHLPPRPSTRRKYINATAERLLADCFPGMIPAAVIEDALRQKAIREGRLTPPSQAGRQP